MANNTSRKRRGSGSHHELQVVGTDSRSPVEQQQQRPPRGSRSPPPSTTRAPLPLNQETKTTEGGGSILIKLSNACNKHAEHHVKKQQQQQRASNSDGAAPFDVRPDPNADESTLPKMCGSAIQTLRKLLPKVEKTIQAVDLDGSRDDDDDDDDDDDNITKRRTNNNNKAKPKETPVGPPEASDVAHLCDFYHSVMGGVYCPHAPHLFHWGKGGIDVLPRVHHLYQHLTTRAVIADPKARVVRSMQQTRESTITVSTAQAGRTTVADTISHTIAKLLSFIPDDALYPCIIFDLVHLLVDLSVVAQTGLLHHEQQTSRQKKVKGTTKKKKNRKKLQVVILSDTVGQSPLAANHNTKTEVSFVLEITSINVLFSLHAATFSILQQFLMDLQLRRIQPLPVTMMVDPATCNIPPVEGAEPSKAPLFQTVGNVDLLFHGVLEDGELLSMLFLALRQVLQSSVVCYSATKTQQLLCLYSKVTSARLLTKLVHDFHKDRVPTLTTAIEVAILICNAVKIFLQDDIAVTGTATVGTTLLSANDVSNYEEMSHEYLQLLATLVRDSILFPPNVHGTSSVAEVLWTMRSATFSTLLDCLALIADKVGTPGTGTLNNGQDSISDRDPLYAIILQAVHAFRFTPPWQQGTATKLNSAAAEAMIWTYCASHGISGHLFVILQQHTTLAEPIIGLLSWLLEPFYNPTPSMSPMTDWNNACLQALEQHHQHTNNTSTSSSTLHGGTTSKSTIVPPPPPKTNPMIVNEDNVDISSDMEVTPKVVGAAGVKRKKQMSVSPRKKKGSAFQPKSLTFEASSPLKKRRRLSVPAATASSGYQVETGLGLYGAPIVWQDALRDFLVAALDASNRLGDSFLQPSTGTFEDERATGPATPESKDESTADTNGTLNGIRLLLSMLQHRCTGDAIHRDDVDFEAPLKVLCSLAKRLQTCCKAIEAGILEDGSLASLQQCVWDAAITCGLHAQFTVEVSLRRWTSNNAVQLRKIFDYFSGLGARLCMNKLLSAQDSSILKVPSCIIPSTRSCSNLCTGVNSAFSVLADNGSSDRSRERSPHSSMCPFIFPDGLGEPSEWLTNSNLRTTQARNCYSMSIINTLPLRTRCCLLASLRPRKDDVILSEDSREIRASRPVFTLDSLVHFFGGKEMPSHVVGDQLSAIQTLVLSPLVLLSHAYNATCNVGETGPNVLNAGSKSEHLGRRLRALVANFITEILGPVSVGLAGTWNNSIHASAFLLTVDRLHWLQAEMERDDGLLDRVAHILTDASSLLDYFSGDLTSSFLDSKSLSDNGKRNQIGVDALRDVLMTVANEVAENHSNSFVRLLRWRCVTEACLRCPRTELREQIGRANFQANAISIERVENNGASMPWILHAPFSDSDKLVRDYTGKRIGRILLSDDCSLLFAIFADINEWRSFNDCCLTGSHHSLELDISDRLLDESDAVTTRLFKEVDRVLRDNCCLTESQLSLTEVKPKEANSEGQIGDRAYLQRSAIRILSSLCTYAEVEKPHGSLVFEKAFLRIVRTWGSTQVPRNIDAPFPDTSSTSSGRAIAFAELSCVTLRRSCDLQAQQRDSTRLAAGFFSDLLIPSSNENREREFRLLDALIRLFVTPSHPGSKFDWLLALRKAWKYVEEQLPALVAKCVAEKDYLLLCLTTGFRGFLLERKASLEKTKSTPEHVVGGSNSDAPRQRGRMILSSKQDLEKKTADLCLEPKLIERILPLIFMNSDRSGLIFFTRDVLKGITLHKMITHREQLILKGFVWELGRNPRRIGQAMRAIRAAAIARTQEPHSSLPDKSSHRALPEEAVGAKESSAASHWVTSHFMYLLVNVIQHKWNSRSSEDRVHALRCLNGLLDFLLPSESSQFFPQIMATVNASIVQDKVTIEWEEAKTISGNFDSNICNLRLLAVEALSKFVRLVAEHQWETIALNLTSIVVSIVPAIESQEQTVFLKLHPIVKRTHDVAVNLLEYLTQGTVGENLAKSFIEIPFLPLSSSLEKVRQSLRSNGVDFDNLLIVSSVTEDATSEGQGLSLGSKLSSTTFPNSDKMTALQKRLAMVCALLDNENSNVRRVVLKHTTDLLRANRELFQALVENEGSTSMKRFLTVDYRESKQTTLSTGSSKGLARGSVTCLVERLLARCVHEAEPETRILLATCLGEVGAISEHRLGEIRMSDAVGSNSVDAERSSSHTWRLLQPPWQSQAAKYELQLVTKLLVVALKAAPSSADQHKIAFTIQQLLVLLDASGRQDRGTMSDTKAAGTKRPEMSKWLGEKLRESKVYEVVEPFWFSEFGEKAEGFVAKQPPFFHASSSHFMWISNFCRWMITCARACALSRWNDLFFACRTAVRTKSGLEVAEFLLPLLVLDRVCFGNAQDEETIRQEIVYVLEFKTSSRVIMNQTERQKAVNVVLTVIDTLRFWAERETEERHKSSRTTPAVSAKGARRPAGDVTNSSNWPADEALNRIAEVLDTIPLSLQADAAANVGMHARSLRLLEMAARQHVVDQIFNSDSQPVDEKPGEDHASLKMVGQHFTMGVNLNLMKDVFAQLDDSETLAAVGEEFSFSDPSAHVRDSIRRKEASGDWEAALQEYERALQLEGDERRDPRMERGSLQCLLEIGQFESVLNQVTGLMRRSHKPPGAKVQASNATHLVPLAIEAAWRLGRWNTLSDLVDDDESEGGLGQTLDHEAYYQIAVGRAMLGLHRKDVNVVGSGLKNARKALMQSLSSAARESYSRSYALIVRLQCLRELENSVDLLCKRDNAQSSTLTDFCQLSTHEGWGWDGRLTYVSAQGSTAVINTRLALARLAGEPSLEGSLFLNLGRKARKNGLCTVAANYFSQAEAKFAGMTSTGVGAVSQVSDSLDRVRTQFAKLKHATGESSTALKILGQDGMQRAFDQMIIDRDNLSKVQGTALRYEKQRIGTLATSDPGIADEDKALMQRFAGRFLKLTQWMAEGGLKGGAEIMGRYRFVHMLSPEWEKGHFQFAKYVDSVMQSRVSALSRRSSQEQSLGSDEDDARAVIILRDTTSQNYILLAIEHYTIALRLSPNHVYQALPRLLSLWFDFTAIRHDKSLSARKIEDGAGGGDTTSGPSETLARKQQDANSVIALNVKSISATSFYTALPQLISRVIHDDEDTATVVREILRRVLTKIPDKAMWPLAWLRGSRDAERAKIGEQIFHDAEATYPEGHKMHSLLKASSSLFKYLQSLATLASDGRSSFISVKPWKGDIELSEFTPPLQAALTVSSLPSNSSGSREAFPRIVPRMRTFASRVGVMSSKARPKKLTAYAVPGTMKVTPSMSQVNASSGRQNCDAGEIHFLVKQEAKGDLRKDARVQDLNNVINRLMTSSSESAGDPRRRRRLHLTTFSVVCLSEDIGILEWVPNTDSLRNLVTKSYNPQALPYSNRRRGGRLANFGDVTLRSNFEKCQNLYFKNGNLSKAASMFYELCLKPYPPLLYWWFVQQFQDPHEWYEARTRFALSTAVWSAVGHVIGLGDRHSENILVDTSLGNCVHVDFDCIFDKGLNLPKPEVVPFRLSPNMVDAFGPTGADGVYSGGLQTAMRTLRDNRDTLLSVLEPFLKDPVIDWKRHRPSQKNAATSSTNQVRQTKEKAKRSISVIDERLRGIYNLRNPNLIKYRRTDGMSIDQDDESAHLLPLSVEGQVHKMIAEAMSHENLIQLYVGWMPWV